MGYIEDIREVVGNRPLLLTGVGVGVFNEKGEILLQKNLDGRWGIPGGFMELGESAEETGRREVLEETGIEIGKLDLVTVVSGSHTHTVLKNGHEYYSVTIVFVSKDIQGGALKADGVETTEACFFKLQELPENLNPMIKSMIFQYVSK
ncbi:NUDIX hydrolase [Sporosarcina thermotolerans]|uniref:NUDIX hydrolase n=1 Tax=Sporosarcina thermotolerans TaxID=633404 RepID=A0AAW9AD82_9BACL|nr:NUDIX hydrolase [Sporosarcina thermotolerans]MDW0117101.1 NUDIX hydrolase [Sporosarcina thermotolerans]WHT47807.1 NUDIX hydrolase [Sporosarcina thermotolerans]